MSLENVSDFTLIVISTVKAMKLQAHNERHAREILRSKFIINIQTNL